MMSLDDRMRPAALPMIRRLAVMNFLTEELAKESCVGKSIFR